MSEENLKIETNLSTSADIVSPIPALPQQCFVVVLIEKEPPDDDVSDGYYEYLITIVTATSKEEAMASQVKKLVSKGYREMDVAERMNDEVREWTDEWFNFWLEVYTPDEPGFWQYVAWEDTQKALVKWAKKNGALASQILTLAQSGDDKGHEAIAHNAAFVSAVEKWKIAKTIPARKLAREAGKAARL
jgi:hypothetical protein